MIGGRIDAYEVAGAADLIDGEELSEFEHGDVNRVLRQVPGVNIQEEDSFGLFPNIGLRGAPVERSSNITLMEDGVLIAPAPYAAPAAYYFPAIGRMDAVEVIKGAGSVRYGPRTIGGAINFRSTPIPTESLAGEASGQLGSRGYYQGHGWIGASAGNFGALVESYQQGSDGFKTIDGLPGAETGFQRQDYRARFAVHTSPDSPVDARLEFAYGRSELEANETYLGLADADFASDPYRRYSASQRDVFTGEHDQYRLTGTLRLPDDTQFAVTLYRNDFTRSWSKLQDIDFDGDGSFDAIQPVFDAPSSNERGLAILRGAECAEGALRIRNNNRVYRSEGVQLSFERPFETGEVRHNLAASLRYHEDEEDRLQNEEFYTQTDGDLVFVRQTAPGAQANREAKAKAIAFYLEDRIEIGGLTLTPGIRYEGIDLTHPTGQAKFSEQDDRNEAELARTALLKGMPGLISIVIAGNGDIVARIWTQTEEAEDIGRLLHVGPRLHISGLKGTPADFLDRQVRLFGREASRQVAGFRCGIAGGGATGSAVLSLLLRLGVQEAVQFDKDIVDETNLNRLHGARRSDVDAKLPKTAIHTRTVEESGLGMTLVSVDAWAGHPGTWDTLKACDVIFCCTDDHAGRLFLNRFARFYGIPVIDVGLAMQRRTDTAYDLFARVSTLVPGHPCLLCGDYVDPQRAREEAIRRDDPDAYEQLKEEAYVLGEGDPSPAVVTFTTEAAAMAVNEWLAGVTGLAGEAGMVPTRMRRFHARDDRRPFVESQPDCPCCNQPATLGRADMQPFLDVVS